MLVLGSKERERFEILRTLGEGGMGIVYEAFDRSRNETVALKTIRQVDGDAIYRLKREFRTLAALEHPNLVRLLDLFVTADDCFFTMELVEGEDFSAYVMAADADASSMSTIDMDVFRPYDDAALRHAMHGLAKGLEALHSRGLLHRDLKPSNVRVTPQGRVVLLDFGLVIDSHARVQQTNADAVIGTVAYMAPEQARGAPELTAACDVYALGVMLYEALTSRIPFDGPLLRVIGAKQAEDPVRPIRVLPTVPRDLDELAMAMLARDPVARPSLASVRERLGGASSPGVPRPDAISGQRRVLPIVGRSAELQKLHELHRRCHAGRPGLAIVRGRSGIGKSALLQAFARDVEKEDGAVVLHGRCYESESVPYKGLDGLVDTLSRVLAMKSPEALGALLPPNVGDLATLFPVLRRVKPFGSAYARRSLGERTVQETRVKAFVCLRELLRRLAESTPLVIALDDVQWADEDSARGLVAVIQGADPPAALFVFGARQADDAPVIRELFGRDLDRCAIDASYAVIELRPLALGAMRELVGREITDDPELVEFVANDARGIPFAAGELVRFLRENEHDVSALEGEGEGDDSTDAIASALPAVDRVVWKRVTMLDERPRALLEMLAVAGEPTTVDLLHRAAGLSADDRSAIDVLRARGFVRSVHSVGAVAVDTAHDRIREVISLALESEGRASRHRALALAMETLEHPSHEKLSRHYAGAADWRSSRHHALLAAEESTAAHAFERAVELCSVALGLADEDDERATDLERLALAQTAAGRHADAAASWTGAADFASDGRRSEFLRRAADSWLFAGRIDVGLDLLDGLGRDFGIVIPTGRFAALLLTAFERLRVFLRGLSFRLRPRSEIRARDLEKLRTLGAIAMNYTLLDPFRGAIPTSRFFRAALDVGDVEELILAMTLEGGVRIGIDSSRSIEPLLAALSTLERQPGDGVGASMAELLRGMQEAMYGKNASGYVRAATVLRRLNEERAMSPALASFAWWIAGMCSIAVVKVDTLDALRRFVESRELLSGAASEFRLRAAYPPQYYLRTGTPEDAMSISSPAIWDVVTKRNVTFRRMADVYEAWNRLYLDEDAAGLLPIVERGRTGLVSTGAWRAAIARGRCSTVLSSLGMRLGRPDLTRRALREFGAARTPLERCFVLSLTAVHELADRRPADAIASFSRLWVEAAEHGNELAEFVAVWSLGNLAVGAQRDRARDRFHELVDTSGTIDPDRYAWSLVPIGEPPVRSRARRSLRFSEVDRSGIARRPRAPNGSLSASA